MIDSSTNQIFSTIRNQKLSPIHKKPHKSLTSGEKSLKLRHNKRLNPNLINFTEKKSKTRGFSLEQKKNRRVFLPIAKDLEKFTITINDVDFMKTEDPTIEKNKLFLDLSTSVSNSSRNRSLDVTPKTKIIEFSTDLKKNKIKPRAHGRYLTKIEMEKFTHNKNKKSIEATLNSKDFSLDVAQKDKEFLREEILFRKYRKHKIMKKLYVNRDENWEWESYGESPQGRVKFFDSNFKD